jgi:hypothetical protein
MVQFAVYWGSGDPNDYWKLQRADIRNASSLRNELQAKNFTVLRNTITRRLRALYVRCQRGLLSYEGLPLRELRLYVAQRGLSLPLDEKPTIGILKAQLEQADDENAFEHFSELPPELRQIIYSLHFESFVESESRSGLKYQPPITLASRNIRQESLPLFYECCDFKVQTRRPTRMDPQQDLTTVLLPQSKAFIDGISAENLAHIRHLAIDLRYLRVGLQLNLTKKEDPISVTWLCPLSRKNLDQTCQERKDRLLLALRKAVVLIAAREGPLKLRKDDLEELYKTSKDILFVQS